MKSQLIFTARLLVLTVVLGVPVLAGDTPFKGKAEGAITSIAPGPMGLEVITLAEGQSTHLGQFVREEHAILDPFTGALSGEMTWTAANGDQLFATVVGGFVSPSVVTGTYVFTGGTGRFQNASGQAEFVLSTPDGIQYSVRFSGAMSY